VPKVVLVGHEDRIPVSDVMNLFFGSCRISGNAVIAGDSEEPVILSERNGTDICTSYRSTSGDRRWCSGPDRLVPKREVKRQLYQALSELTGRRFPWGSLTGIRPTLMAAECDYDPEQLRDRFYVSAPKAIIAAETARNEKRLLDDIPQDSVHLYIGIPFCSTRCEYCSFPMAEYGKMTAILPAYIDALIRELDFFVPSFAGRIASVYVGGGTPTGLPTELFTRLMHGIERALGGQRIGERTVEAGRPDSITGRNLQEMREAGFDRICINPQTFHQRTLDRIGRRHSPEAIYEAVYAARDAGFATINMDLIAGLQGETTDDFRFSLAETIRLSPENITVHSLSLKRTSDLKRHLAADMDADVHEAFDRLGPDIADMLAYSHPTLAENGYKPYYMYRQKDTLGGHENIGYTTPGHACVYNTAMMGDRHTVFGAGAKAMSKRVIPSTEGYRIERFPNKADIRAYLADQEEHFRKKRAFLDGLV
jgi:oxygen-independent coproporphyrinogen III oxidase